MNKPQLSVITTSPEGQPSKTGMQPGARGLATLVGLDALPQHATPELARHMMGCLRVFKAQLPADCEEAERAKAAIDLLTAAAPAKWIGGRVVSLLSHYFVAQQDAGVATAVADDWCSMLEPYPAWAIANACRWWISRENPRKHCKPLPGDIEERCHVELEPVRAARITLGRGTEKPRTAEPVATEHLRPTPEEREHRRAIAESLGLRVIKVPRTSTPVTATTGEEHQ